ncbi:MAG: transketolase family protein [Nitrosopumilaceae archaeon]|nr:transketolase family protein [Nitrosopumilaceae archaeon]
MESNLTDMRTVYGKTLIELGKSNHRIVVIGADTTNSLKISQFGKIFKNRFFNVGIAEANLVSIAAGLANAGKIVFAGTYAIFVPGRCVDQIRNAIAYPSRCNQKGLNVKLVVSHGGISVGADGGSHQQLEDIAIMRTIPNMKVLIPADSVSVSELTRIMSEKYGPFYMRMARPKTHTIHHTSQKFLLGKGIIVNDGSDCTIAACGITVKMALDAARLLKKDGISCQVIDMFSIKPLDNDILEKSARKTGFIITCEEHNVIAGFGSAVCETISNTYPVPIKRIGINDSFGESARDSEMTLLFKKHKLTPEDIANNVREIRR